MSNILLNKLSTELIYDTSCNQSETQKTFVTVCSSCYCCEKTIIQALESLLQQTYRDYEIIISDDCSTDCSVSVLLAFLKSYTGNIPIKLFKSIKNQGTLWNRFPCLYFGKGQLFVLADGDDYSFPDRLEKVVECWNKLENKPSIIATNSIIVRNEIISNEISIPGSDKMFSPGDPVNTPFICYTAGFVLSRQFFDLFKENLPTTRIIADDSVLGRRAILANGMYFMSQPVFYYRYSPSSTSGSGCNGKNWILDRINRWDLLLSDIAYIRPDHTVPPGLKKRILHERKKMEIDAKAIDCRLWIWWYYWLRMILLSPQESVAMLKKRIKLIVRGSVNAPWKRKKETGENL